MGLFDRFKSKKQRNNEDTKTDEIKETHEVNHVENPRGRVCLEVPFDPIELKDNYQLIALNIAEIYYCLEKTAYGKTLDLDHKLLATGIIDAQSHLHEKTLSIKDIEQAVLMGTIGYVGLGLYSRQHFQLLDFEENRALVGFTMQMEALIFNVSDTGVSSKDLVDIVLKKKTVIADTIKKTLRYAEDSEYYSGFNKLVSAIAFDPTFQAVVNAFRPDKSSPNVVNKKEQSESKKNVGIKEEGEKEKTVQKRPKYYRNPSGNIDCPGDNCPHDCDDDCPIYCNDQAMRLMQQGDEGKKKARVKLEKAIKIAPDFSDAWNNLGACLGALNYNREAGEAYSKAIKLRAGNYPNALYGLAVSYKNTGNYNEALDTCNQFMKKYGEQFNIGAVMRVIELRNRPGTTIGDNTFKKSADILLDLEYASGKLLWDADPIDIPLLIKKQEDKLIRDLIALLNSKVDDSNDFYSLTYLGIEYAWAAGMGAVYKWSTKELQDNNLASVLTGGTGSFDGFSATCMSMMGLSGKLQGNNGIIQLITNITAIALIPYRNRKDDREKQFYESMTAAFICGAYNAIHFLKIEQLIIEQSALDRKDNCDKEDQETHISEAEVFSKGNNDAEHKIEETTLELDNVKVENIPEVAESTEVEKERRKIYCPYCGTELIPETVYCFSCGKKIPEQILAIIRNQQ